MLDPDRYFPLKRDELIFRLIEVTAELCSLHRELHDAVVEERRLRFKAFQASIDTSIAAKDRAADIESYGIWVAVQDCKAQIADYTEERDLIRLLIEHA